MSKTCMIYETLNGVKELSVERKDGLMQLSGVFGVCGVRNNNKRVYEAGNYSKMVTEMKQRIKEEGGIPGELEHPQNMNITLENVSHKITDINIDKNGVVTGTITLLNTPKGQIAQAIVEGGLPLFISSRATGNVDPKSGSVTLERISTYDLVGTPGFSQAKLHLNEGQVAESICESMYYITDNTNDDNNNVNENNIFNDMELKEVFERLESLENEIQDLKEHNRELQSQLDVRESLDLNRLANGIQKWIFEEYSPQIEKWILEEYSNKVREIVDEESYNQSNKEVIDEAKEEVIRHLAPKLEKWILEEYSPVVENWCKTELAGGIQKWVLEEYTPGVENWVVKEYSPAVEKWMNESYIENVQEKINESKRDSLSTIDETLKLLENIETTKPTYPSKSFITENYNEPKYIQDMPADVRVKWDMASNEVKESIQRRAKLYNFVNEGSIERFWQNIDFENIKPINNIYESLSDIQDRGERQIRAQLRRWRNR